MGNSINYYFRYDGGSASMSYIADANALSIHISDKSRVLTVADKLDALPSIDVFKATRLTKSGEIYATAEGKLSDMALSVADILCETFRSGVSISRETREISTPPPPQSDEIMSNRYQADSYGQHRKTIPGDR